MQNNKSVALQFYDALNHGGDEKLVRKIFAENWVVHPSLPGEGADLDKYLQSVKPVFKALPDFKITVHKVLAEEDHVAVNGQITATHKDNLFGVPATNKQISFMAQDIHRIENGKIAESWHLEDWLSVLFQVGAIKL